MNTELLKQIGKLDVPDAVVQGWVDEWNPIIRVDRTVRPVYPDFVKEVKYPEFELTGPAEFDVTKLERHLHQKQKDGSYAIGNEIHGQLIAEKKLEGCLNLVDLLAIQIRSIGFFRKHFSGKAVFAWRSVVLNRYGNLNVPCLYERDGEVELDWIWFGSRFDSDDPALRRAS